MRYMQELPQATVAPDLLRWLASPVNAEGRAKWLLFDGAILGKKATGNLKRTLPAKAVHNIFSNTEFAAYGWAAPHLVRIPQGPRGTNCLNTLLEHAAGKPSAAVLDACEDLDTLCSGLLWLAQAKTFDRMGMYCRFADTRITPALMEVLCLHQRSELHRCVDDWRIVDRKGALLSICPLFSKTPVEAAPCNSQRESVEEFVLSDEQFLAMMRSAEADEIFQMLCEGTPDLVPESQLGDFHRRLLTLAVAARQRGLESTSEIFQFTVIALTTCDSFFSHPELDGFWRQVGEQSGAFASLVKEWPDDTWTLLASRAGCESLNSSMGANT